VTGLAPAVERRDWRVVSLYLLVGVSEAASRLPPESLEELLNLLGAEKRRKTETDRGR
jgi:class 3 adenylate cyclase